MIPKSPFCSWQLAFTQPRGFAKGWHQAEWCTQMSWCQTVFPPPPTSVWSTSICFLMLAVTADGSNELFPHSPLTSGNFYPPFLLSLHSEHSVERHNSQNSRGHPPDRHPIPSRVIYPSNKDQLSFRNLRYFTLKQVSLQNLFSQFCSFAFCSAADHRNIESQNYGMAWVGWDLEN